MRSPPVIIIKDRDVVGGIRFLSTLGKERQQALVKRLARLAAVVKPTLSPLPLETARAATFEHFSRSRLSSETTDVLVETMFHALEFLISWKLAANDLIIEEKVSANRCSPNNGTQELPMKLVQLLESLGFRRQSFSTKPVLVGDTQLKALGHVETVISLCM